MAFSLSTIHAAADMNRDMITFYAKTATMADVRRSYLLVIGQALYLPSSQYEPPNTSATHLYLIKWLTDCPAILTDYLACIAIRRTHSDDHIRLAIDLTQAILDAHNPDNIAGVLDDIARVADYVLIDPAMQQRALLDIHNAALHRTRLLKSRYEKKE